MQTVGVMTVDDQAVFRRAARKVVDATPGFVAVGEACSAEEALALADRLDPDLVLMDVRMPDIDGIEAARRMSAAHPRAVIVLISIEDRLGIPSDAEACGAAAFVSKREFGPRLLRRLWAMHGAVHG